jgi:hypothetical protein
MADTPFYSPNHTPPPPTTVPGPGERLWRVRKDHRTVEAELRYHPEGLGGGVEVQFYYRGEFVYGRRWATREAAVAEADDKLRELVQRGWATHW